MSHPSSRQAARIRICSAVSIIAAAVLWQTGTSAQTLYRCGNVYQDQPCSGAQKEKRLGVAASFVGPQASNADASCTQRGTDALKIVWRREAGMTLEQASGQAGSTSEKALVEEVYRVRGSAPEVRARIESECMAEKERRERYAAASPTEKPAAGVPAAGTPVAGTPAAIGLPPTPPAASAGKLNANSAGTPVVSLGEEARSPKPHPECQRLAAQLESIRTQQRTGGDAGRMEQLRTELNNTQRVFRQHGCS